MDADDNGGPQSGRYREIAEELRLLVPKMKYATLALQLRLLIARYERLAEHVEAAQDPRQDIEGAR